MAIEDMRILEGLVLLKLIFGHQLVDPRLSMNRNRLDLDHTVRHGRQIWRQEERLLSQSAAAGHK